MPNILIQRARYNRQNITPPEIRIWKAIKNKAIQNIKFLRQFPIPPYLIDFYASSIKLALEINGLQHDNQISRDLRRKKYLEDLGIMVVDIPAYEVFANFYSVMEMIDNIVSIRRKEFVEFT